MRKKKNKTKTVLICAVFVILICIIAGKCLGDSTNDVVVAACDIKAGTQIDSNNINTYFKLAKVNKDVIPNSYYESVESLNGKVVRYDMYSNTLITDNFILDENSYISGLKNPVITGIRATDSSQFAGGVIRKGDFIDISVVDDMTNECTNIISNVYVDGAFNNDGTEITDENGCAMILNVLVEKENEQYINQMLETGKIRVCKTGKEY